MTRTRHTDVTHGHGALPRDLTANQRRPVELVTRRAAQRAERAALDKLAGAATDQLVPIGTHHQQPDPSQILDTGQPSLRSDSSNAGVARGALAEDILRAISGLASDGL